MLQKKKILVCPLDWGLGHAARMVPVIEMIEKKGASAIIAADNNPAEFLKQRFPKSTFVKLAGYSPKYPANGDMAMAMIKSLPKMLRKAHRSKKELHKIINNHNINAVISDNRYELYTSKIPSIFITHQLNIQTSGWQTIGKPIIDILINHYLNKFSEIWIPDITGDSRLSGKLSVSINNKAKQFNVGLLSRFSTSHIHECQKSIDLLIILSGPEPQRTILEELLLSQVLGTELKTVILLAKPSEYIEKKMKNVKLISHLPDTEFSEIIQSAKIIISRPGYSTLMDLAVFNKQAIFIPTPGQTEQEYLAKKLFEERIAFSQTQSNFSLTEALLSQEHFRGLFLENEPKLLENRIDNLLRIC